MIYEAPTEAEREVLAYMRLSGTISDDPQWTSAEQHFISTVMAAYDALIEGPPVYGDARTVALVRHVQRKAIQLAFAKICEP